MTSLCILFLAKTYVNNAELNDTQINMAITMGVMNINLYKTKLNDA